MTLEQLEELYKTFRVAQRDYFRLRYGYWKAISQIKKQTHREDGLSFKEFSRRCRRATKRVRRELLASKPRGKTNLDHKTSIFKAWTIGWSVEQTCSKENLRWLSRSENLYKGILSEE